VRLLGATGLCDATKCTGSEFHDETQEQRPITEPNRKRPQDPALTEAELADEIMGNNQLQGNDQRSVRNQRHAVPDAKLEPDADPVESAKMLDKDARARAELGKGNRDGDKGGEGNR